MSLIDKTAERLLGTLVSSMGFTPQQIQGFVGEIVGKFRLWDAEREAFKKASGQVVPDVLARLERIEKMLSDLHVEISPNKQGAINGRRHDDTDGGGIHTADTPTTGAATG